MPWKQREGGQQGALEPTIFKYIISYSELEIKKKHFDFENPTVSWEKFICRLQLGKMGWGIVALAREHGAHDGKRA